MTDGPEQTHGFDRSTLQGMQGLRRLAQIPATAQHRAVQQGLEYGLEAAESVQDRRISTFSRGAQPAFAGINTFLKAPYCEDMRELGGQDVAIVGAPFDGGTTYRPGARFGPRAMRPMTPSDNGYNFEMGSRPGRIARDRRRRATSPSSRPTSKRPSIRSTRRSATSTSGPSSRSCSAATTPSATPISAASPACRRQRRHHPLRPPFRPLRVQLRRADARHAVLPRHEHPERPGHQPGPDRHRRLDGQSRPGMAVARERQHDRHHHDRHRPLGGRADVRDGPGERLEGRQGGLSLLRHRLRRSRIRPRHRHPRDRAASPRARSSACWASSPARDWSAWRWSRSRRTTTRPT